MLSSPNEFTYGSDTNPEEIQSKLKALDQIQKLESEMQFLRKNILKSQPRKKQGKGRKKKRRQSTSKKI